MTILPNSDSDASTTDAYRKTTLSHSLAFILISGIFSAILLPLLGLLFALSTPHSRSTPIFILDVVAICLGIVVGGLCIHLSIEQIITPSVATNTTEDFAFNALCIWMPWITEAVLLLRVIVVFRPTLYARVRNAVLLLAFPVVVKLARAAINVIYLVQWSRFTKFTSISSVNPRALAVCDLWIVEVSWILELLDNGYISGLFLWRLGSHVYQFSNVRLASGESRFIRKLKTLFWIASTNFVFPLIFGVCQVVILFTGDIVVGSSIKMANTYVAIVSTVLATIWASTGSHQANGLSQSDELKTPLESLRFRRSRVLPIEVSIGELGHEEEYKFQGPRSYSGREKQSP